MGEATRKWDQNVGGYSDEAVRRDSVEKSAAAPLGEDSPPLEGESPP